MLRKYNVRSSKIVLWEALSSKSSTLVLQFKNGLKTQYEMFFSRQNSAACVFSKDTWALVFDRHISEYQFYCSQKKMLERRKRLRWVVLEALFITFSPNIEHCRMKSASKTTHRNRFRRSRTSLFGGINLWSPNEDFGRLNK